MQSVTEVLHLVEGREEVYLVPVLALAVRTGSCEGALPIYDPEESRGLVILGVFVVILKDHRIAVLAWTDASAELELCEQMLWTSHTVTALVRAVLGLLAEVLELTSK